MRIWSFMTSLPISHRRPLMLSAMRGGSLLGWIEDRCHFSWDISMSTRWTQDAENSLWVLRFWWQHFFLLSMMAGLPKDNCQMQWSCIGQWRTMNLMCSGFSCTQCAFRSTHGGSTGRICDRQKSNSLSTKQCTTLSLLVTTCCKSNPTRTKQTDKKFFSNKAGQWTVNCTMRPKHSPSTTSPNTKIAKQKDTHDHAVWGPLWERKIVAL
jgi:hypothetical protein